MPVACLWAAPGADPVGGAVPALDPCSGRSASAASTSTSALVHAQGLESSTCAISTRWACATPGAGACRVNARHASAREPPRRLPDPVIAPGVGTGSPGWSRPTGRRTPHGDDCGQRPVGSLDAEMNPALDGAIRPLCCGRPGGVPVRQEHADAALSPRRHNSAQIQPTAELLNVKQFTWSSEAPRRRGGARSVDAPPPVPRAPSAEEPGRSAAEPGFAASTRRATVSRPRARTPLPISAISGHAPLDLHLCGQSDPNGS